MNVPAPDPRLRTAADFVRQGAVFADIGTDHAYLPLFLLSEGKILRAVCTDINEGPLAAARAHAALTPYKDKMTFRLADGAACLADDGVTDVAICGMGGELIADILSRAPFFEREGVRLILQPMTRHTALRQYLADRGFSVCGEAFPLSEGKRYVVLAAEFSGSPYALSPVERELGRITEEKLSDPAFREYAEGRARTLRKIAEGKRRGGEDSGEEESLLLQIRQLFTR